MEKLNQVWEKVSLDGLIMEKLYQVWVKLESGWFGHGEAVSGLGET